MTEYKFEENDFIGEKTLSVISEADNFNNWMYQTIKPFCKGRILEIGSGTGNISKYFIKENYQIHLSDIRSGYCDNLNKKYKNEPSFLGVKKLDLTDPLFDSKLSNLTNTFDTVFALNVVEHIKDDELAISNCYKLLKPGGHLIILVPSYNVLYNTFDIGLGHFRRYNKKSLEQLFLSSRLKILHKQYFNFIGIFGWFVSGKILKNDSIPGGQMTFYNRLVPFFKIIDKVIFNAFGLSTFMVAIKE